MPVARFAVNLSPSEAFTNLGRQAVALSPDGTSLMYVANGRLNIRRLSALEARPIAGSDVPGGPIAPAFSPDGQAIAFRANGDGTLKRIALSGGAPVTICPIPLQVYGLSWHEQAIVFGRDRSGSDERVAERWCPNARRRRRGR